MAGFVLIGVSTPSLLGGRLGDNPQRSLEASAQRSESASLEHWAKRPRGEMMALRHIVLFGFVNETSEQIIAEVVRRFGDLKALVPGILSFEWGQNCSTEGLDKGHSHAFVLTFPSEEARDAYLPHPAHKAFVDWVGPHLSSATVIDYWFNQAADR